MIDMAHEAAVMATLKELAPVLGRYGSFGS